MFVFLLLLSLHVKNYHLHVEKYKKITFLISFQEQI